MNKREQVIEVVDYTPKWIDQFESEADLIEDVFGSHVVAIHHIGSTSVPNMPSKPTIDILLEVKDIEDVDDLSPQMERAGYECWGEYNIPGRRFYLKGEDKRTHHVHAFTAGNPEVKRHLAVRDYLIAHSEEAHEYANLKRKLAEAFAQNRRAYVIGKSDYVKTLEQRALAWLKE